MKKNWLTAAIFILAPLILGFLTSMPLDIEGKYMPLIKPPLSPAPGVFPYVWAVLYLLMGIGSYLAYRSAKESSGGVIEVLRPYAIQLIFNLLWSPVFFGLGNFALGSIISVLIIIFLVWTIYAFSRVNKTAAYLQIPYLIWSLFAAYLSFGIWILN